MQKGVEHVSIAPRKKWTELIMPEEIGTSLPHCDFQTRVIDPTFTDGQNRLNSSSFPSTYISPYALTFSFMCEISFFKMIRSF